jgi:hypothetical protein
MTTKEIREFVKEWQRYAHANSKDGELTSQMLYDMVKEAIQKEKRICRQDENYRREKLVEKIQD